MRVVAGKYRSRVLKTLRGMALRPTSDRLRETLFNILGPGIEDSVFVDVYAGSGAVGIEALSRGARQVVFIEKHAAAVALIQKNLVSLGIEFSRLPSGQRKATAVRVAQPISPRIEILAVDAVQGLEMLAGRHMLSDFFFLDPPYAERREYERTLEFLAYSTLLSRTGRVIVEHTRKLELPDLLERLERTRVVEQGNTALSFYRLALAA